jgi:hypothetical protein
MLTYTLPPPSESIVRLAHAKFVTTGQVPSLPDAISRLILDHIAPAAERLDSREWRSARLLTTAVDTALRPSLSALQGDAYAAIATFRPLGGKTREGTDADAAWDAKLCPASTCIALPVMQSRGALCASASRIGTGLCMPQGSSTSSVVLGKQLWLLCVRQTRPLMTVAAVATCPSHSHRPSGSKRLRTSQR